LFKERARSVQAISLFIDTVVLAVAYIGAFLLRSYHEQIPLLRELEVFPDVSDQAVSAEYALILIVNVVVWIVYMNRQKVYVSGASEIPNRYLLIFAKGVLLQVFVTGAIVFGLKIALSRLLFGYFFLGAFALLVTKQSLINGLVQRARASDPFQQHVLVIGSLRPAAWFGAVVSASQNTGHKLEGVLLLRPESQDKYSDVPILGTIEDLDNVLRDRPIGHVFLVGSARELAEMGPLAQNLIERGRVVSLVTALNTSEDGVRGRVTEFNGVPVISYGPMPRDEVTTSFRRGLDVVGAGLLLFAFSPLMVLIAALIKWLDPGPVLFTQQRMGRGGKAFPFLKFRSMHIDAEEILRKDRKLWDRYVASDYKLPEKEDPRVSRLGRFLRRTSLDELPQFWNVLRGEMSLVGPRPITSEQLEQYAPYTDLLLSVKPGLTGRWQVSGRSSIKGADRTYIDLDYIGENSVLSDLAIVARTVPEVFKRTGAH
jgi:exopolysaccharide biosynthesis polyprenyl glycosylphosphotransferase